MTHKHSNPLFNVLADAGQVGMTWHFGKDDLAWHGDAAAVLMVDAAQVPATGHDFKRLINPQDLPAFMSTLQELVGRLGSGSRKKKDREGESLKSETVLASVMFRFRARNGLQNTYKIQGRISMSEDGITPRLDAVLVNLTQAQPVIGTAPSTVRDHDDVSGRTYIASRIERLLVSSTAHDGVMNRGYFMALGVDRVGLLNEAYGAACVDTVLMDVEKRLSAILSHNAEVSRISGDIYGIVFPDLVHQEADNVAALLLQHFSSNPFVTMYGPVMMSLSIGGAPFLEAAEKGSDVIARAEAGMREAKARGRGCFVVTPGIAQRRENAQKILEAGQKVFKALEEGRMRMAFQPVIAVGNEQVSFFECLIRMLDHDGKLVPAYQFVPALEGLGMTRVIDVFALHAAVRELKAFSSLSLSVNVSNVSLTDPAWLRSAVSLLKDHPDVASRLVVEITESSAMQDMDAARRVITTLKQMGCRIALDDFGAGQTSFIQLKELHIDIVKIDKDYIRNIGDPTNKLFVRALLDLAAGLGIQTVAEGAETIEEAEYLKTQGVDNIQGYAYGFPSIERVWLPKNHRMRTQKA